MTYFPEVCFDRIKAYAGIHPARYHNKKIATMVDARREHFREIYKRGRPIPLIYEIQFLEEQVCCASNDTELEDAHSNVDECCLTHAIAFYFIDSINWQQRQITRQSLVWRKLTTKPSLPYFSVDAQQYASSCYMITLNELTQFCRNNNISKKRYTKLNKHEIISLLLHYNFEDLYFT
jgi:hypothetical protein